jgi:hypothetical protein
MQEASAMSRERLLEPDRGASILARSIFKELKGNGYSRDQILSVASEIISQVTDDLPAQGELRV